MGGFVGLIRMGFQGVRDPAVQDVYKRQADDRPIASTAALAAAYGFTGPSECPNSQAICRIGGGSVGAWQNAAGTRAGAKSSLLISYLSRLDAN